MSETDLRKTNLNLLLVFEVLMSERHVGRAATRLHLTQSAVSHSLGRLREALNDPLFVRNPKGVEPTPRAVEIAGTITGILDSARAVLTSGPTFDRHRAHTFSIGATDAGTHAVLVPLMAHLRATAPLINLRVITINRANVIDEIDRMHIDLALSAFSRPAARLTCVPIRRMRFVGIARQDHPAFKSRRTLTAQQFVDLPHLVMSQQRDIVDPMEEHLARMGLRRNVAMIQPHYLAAPLIVGRTDLVCIVEQQLALMFKSAAQLRIFELPLEAPSATIDILLSSVRSSEPAIAWLQEQIVALFRETEADTLKSATP